MKKILITGSNGFLVSNFLRKVIYEQNQKKPQDRLYKFVSIDRMTANNNNMYWNTSHSFYLADICDAHIVDRIFQFEKPDIVIHSAAESHVDTSLKDPNIFINSNVLGTQVIINNCLKYKTEKLIYTSSDEIYGQLTNENDPSWMEDAPLAPRSPYSASKAAGELLVKAAHASYGLIYNITRSSNCYGPYQLSEKLIPKAIKCIVEGQKIPIYGKGLQIRDWTYVTDNCSAVMTILEKGVPNEIYNISAHQEFTNIETIQEVCNAMGKGHELVSFVNERPGHDFRYSVNTDKLQALGWKPSIKFREGIVKTCEWYNMNQWILR
jgi:dTDP-glucose 4,6-dehydratase